MNRAIQALLVTDLKASIAANETTFAAKSCFEPSFLDPFDFRWMNFASRRVGASTFSCSAIAGVSAKARPLGAAPMTAFSFHLRDGSELLSVELPSAWCDSTVGRLQAFIAAKRGLEGWSCHLVTARGPADTLLVVREAS